MPHHIAARIESASALAQPVDTADALRALPYPVLVVVDDGVQFANPSAQALLEGQDVLADILAAARSEAASRFIDTDAGRFTLFVADGGNQSCVVSLIPADALPAIALPVEKRDELTGLVLRSGLIDRLDRALADASFSVAIHCIDLDRFKAVNDTLGHEIGDQLLSKVARRIVNACREGDVVARMGGDEFIVMQTGVASEVDTAALAARLVDLLGRTYVIEGHTVNVGASIGHALDDGQCGARDLIRNADLALYEAKRTGRARHCSFLPEMQEALRIRKELETALRRALALRQFELDYQPFLDLAGNRVVGCEALLRWNHPQQGRISPAAFIPLAEETGLIGKIGTWVLRTACKTAAAWPDGMTVAVNVSPVQFKTDTLVGDIRTALSLSGLAPERLEIEITEGALLEDTDNVLKTLYEIRDLGVRISMDDFGTGYSSLSYLQKFPFSKIKIDQSFIRGADRGGESEAILKAIAGLGSSLGMAITAEGVETAAQLARIRAERCTYAQGFFTGRPMSSDALANYLSTFDFGALND